MRALSILLKIKVAITVLAWCLPLLFFPASALEWLGFPEQSALIFVRLLAVAYTALVVGYVQALGQIRRGSYPWSTVWVGAVSNGGACALLTIAAISGEWANWGLFAQVFMAFSTWGTGLITLGLLVSAAVQAFTGPTPLLTPTTSPTANANAQPNVHASAHANANANGRR